MRWTLELVPVQGTDIDDVCGLYGRMTSPVVVADVRRVCRASDRKGESPAAARATANYVRRMPPRWARAAMNVFHALARRGPTRRDGHETTPKRIFINARRCNTPSTALCTTGDRNRTSGMATTASSMPTLECVCVCVNGLDVQSSLSTRFFRSARVNTFYTAFGCARLQASVRRAT